MSTNIYTAICLKCQNQFTKEIKWGHIPKYCSRSCANSRIRTKEIKQAVSKKLKGTKHSEEQIKKFIATGERNGTIRLKTKCVICNNATNTRGNKTCSKICLIQLQRINALKQKSHGGGHKGTYKNIICDSSYELAFLIWHLDNNIPIARCTEIRKYIYHGIVKAYNPDFVVSNKIYEIKGFMSKQSKAKLDQNQDINLVSSDDIKKYIKYVKDRYKVLDLRDLYDVKSTITHICKNCNTEFENYKTTSIFCSPSCAGKHKHKINMKNGTCGFIKLKSAVPPGVEPGLF